MKDSDDPPIELVPSDGDDMDDMEQNEAHNRRDDDSDDDPCHQPQLHYEAEAAAVAAVSASYQTQLEHQRGAEALADTEDQDDNNNNNSNNDNSNSNIMVSNKWAKNGYGAAVSKQSSKFTRDESEHIKAAIEEYCNARQISVARLCSECDHKAELKGAWMDIAKCLPNRTVQSVYRHGIRQCHPFKRGAWSEAECTMLTELVTTMGKKWSAIQTKLNRSADSCRDKYREMSDEYIKGRWKEEETLVLIKLIRDHLNQVTNGATAGLSDIKDLGKYVESENVLISWSIISKRMGKRSRLSCFKKWQKMTGLGVEEAVAAADDAAGVKRAFDADEEAVLLNDDDEEEEPPGAKRIKTESHHDETSHAVAELAAETVEALELPEVTAPVATQSV